MNKLLELKGSFLSSGANHPGPISLPKDADQHPITISHLTELKNQLAEIYEYWQGEPLINGALITVYQTQIIAKSNRISGILREANMSSDDSIRGAKFNEQGNKHIFTYFLSLQALHNAIDSLEKTIQVIQTFFPNGVNKQNIDNIRNYDFNQIITRTKFCTIIKDSYYIEKFDISRNVNIIQYKSIVSLYKTGVPSIEILRNIGINLNESKILDDDTFVLDPNQFDQLKNRASYLIAMNVTDLSEYRNEDLNSAVNDIDPTIPLPSNEPTIGVFDTLFKNDVYFSRWVDFVDMVDPNFEKTIDDYEHGTAISSLIVDGPKMNPSLDDGCGRFKVKHFGIALKNKFSTVTIIKSIKKAVQQNPDIKVWNLSLGSVLEINNNYISPEAAELDRLQNEYDVIFVVSGTNRRDQDPPLYKIGAPADSLNSLVVNSVKRNNEQASYCRVGPVLSFFYKPDISYYGGDYNEKLTVFSASGPKKVMGTSYAAPWISRKLAYLIYIMGFSREIAKALLIDAAAGWSPKDTNKFNIGYGVVPIKIDDIISSKNDEIKFIFSGQTEEYKTFTNNIPIPLDQNRKHPFAARATLCYFPQCRRNQGVDYTETEVDFKFGRIKPNNVIEAFNKNRQDEEGFYTTEAFARKQFRKWDNIKHIGCAENNNLRAKKSYGNGLCGVRMTIKNRTSNTHSTLKFGIVITLKEINGRNRINEFINMCLRNQWFVRQIDVNNRITIYNKTQEEIEFKK